MLLGIQATFVELGRIRVGRRDDRGRPEGLETFRLTSQDRAVLEEAAARFGGEVRPWRNDRTTDRYELLTEAAELPVIVPPGQVFSQDYELWSGAGLVRRCDGVRQYDPDRSPCVCPAAAAERARLAAEGAACRPTTRWSLFLEGIGLVGVWRLDARGYEAAEELLGSYLQVMALSRGGRLVRARLLITERQRRRDGKVFRYRVPALVPVMDEPAQLVTLAGFAGAAFGPAAAVPAAAGEAPAGGGAGEILGPEAPEDEPVAVEEAEDGDGVLAEEERDAGGGGGPAPEPGPGPAAAQAPEDGLPGVLDGLTLPPPEGLAALGAEAAAALAGAGPNGRKAKAETKAPPAPEDPVAELRAYMEARLGRVQGRRVPAAELARAFRTAAGVEAVQAFFEGGTIAEARALVDRIAGAVRSGASLMDAAAAVAAGRDPSPRGRGRGR